MSPRNSWLAEQTDQPTSSPSSTKNARGATTAPIGRTRDANSAKLPSDANYHNPYRYTGHWVNCQCTGVGPAYSKVRGTHSSTSFKITEHGVRQSVDGSRAWKVEPRAYSQCQTIQKFGKIRTLAQYSQCDTLDFYVTRCSPVLAELNLENTTL